MYLSQLSGDGDIVSSEKLFKDSTVNLDGREVVCNHTGVIIKCIRRCVNTRFVQAISLSLGAVTEQAIRSNKPTAGSEMGTLSAAPRRLPILVSPRQTTPLSKELICSFSDMRPMSSAVLKKQCQPQRITAAKPHHC